MTVHPISVRELHVVRVADITPAMRRVTLGGPQLGTFTSANGYDRPPFTSPGFDDAIRLIFPYPGETEPVLPVQKEGGVSFPKGRRPLTKVYSVRHWDPEAGEVNVDFVKHGVGVATTWAYRAEPGDRIHMGGPSLSRKLPVHADWLLVVGDETALPAIGRLLEELPEDTQAQVFIEVGEDSHIQSLTELPHVTVTWLTRNGAEPGTTTLLLDAVRSATWLSGQPFAWVAAEQAATRDIRRHLADERGVPKEDIEFTAYWRRTEVVAREDDDAVPDQEKSAAAFDTFHDLTELIPPIAIRTAAGLDIGDLISRGVTSVPDLAARTGSDERALGKLLRYLHSIDVLEETADRHYGLTAVGEFLTADLWIDKLHPDGAVGRQFAGIVGLAESVRTGEAVYAAITGKDFATLRSEQWYEDKFLEQVARLAGFLADPLAKSSALGGVEHLVIHSNGAGVLAREITAAHARLRVSICALPAQADWLRRDIPDSVPDEEHRSRISVAEQSIFEPSPEADSVLILKALAALPDADAAHALRRASENLRPGGSVLLVEDTFNLSELDEHDAEADLLALTRDGSGLRTDEELQSVIESSGMLITGSENIGWGSTLHRLTPRSAG